MTQEKRIRIRQVARVMLLAARRADIPMVKRWEAKFDSEAAEGDKWLPNGKPTRDKHMAVSCWAMTSDS